MMEVMEMTLTRLVGDCFAAPPPALLGVDVVDEEVDVDEGVVEVDVGGDDEDEVVVRVVSPPFWKGLPNMPTEAAAGPVVLIEATEDPLTKEKKSELVLSQQTLDAFRLWSQHHSPP